MECDKEHFQYLLYFTVLIRKKKWLLNLTDSSQKLIIII